MADKLLLIGSDNKLKCLKPVSSLADGTTVTYNETTGKFSATQGTPSSPAEYTTASEIPAKITDDASGTSPAAVVKMLKYLRPTSSTGGYTDEQSSANAIGVQLFNNVTCDGSGNITSFKIPKPGSSTEFCTVTIPQGSGGNTPTLGTVWQGSSAGCITVAESGLYYAVISSGGSFVQYCPFVNIAGLPDDNLDGSINGYPRCLVLMTINTGNGVHSVVGGIAGGQVKAKNGTGSSVITKIVRVM